MAIRPRPTSTTVWDLTKLRPGEASPPGAAPAPRLKVYANPREVIVLPPPQRRGGPPTWELLGRAAGGPIEGGHLRRDEIAQLLWAAAGTDGAPGPRRVRSGLRSALETYVVVRGVVGLSAGVYHHAPREHALEQLDDRSPDEGLQAALDGFPTEPSGAVRSTDVAAFEGVAAVVVWTGVLERLPEARARAVRHLSFEAGAAAQALAWAAEAIGLATELVGDFFDDRLAAYLGVDPRREAPLAMAFVGR